MRADHASGGRATAGAAHPSATWHAAWPLSQGTRQLLPQGCQLKGRIVKSFDLTLGGRLGATNHVTQKPQHLWDITFCTKISNAAWSSGAISFIPE